MTAHAHTLAATHNTGQDAVPQAAKPATTPGTPMTASPPREAKFWDKAAAKYARSPIADQAAYEHKLEVTRQYLGPDMNVLEFGCGTGSTALLHAPYVKHILATDFSARMIEIAKAKLPGSDIDNVTFATGTLDGLDAPAGSFDAVMAMSVLHLLADPKAAMSRVHETPQARRRVHLFNRVYCRHVTADPAGASRWPPVRPGPIGRRIHRETTDR